MEQNNQEFMTPEDALAHYGVRGMKWGVRKDTSSGSRLSSSRKKKVAIGVGVGAVVIGATAAAIILNKRGSTPTSVVTTATKTAKVAKNVHKYSKTIDITDVDKYVAAQKRAAQLGKVWVASADNSAMMLQPLSSIYSPETIAKLYPDLRR